MDHREIKTFRGNLLGFPSRTFVPFVVNAVLRPIQTLELFQASIIVN